MSAIETSSRSTSRPTTVSAPAVSSTVATRRHWYGTG